MYSLEEIKLFADPFLLAQKKYPKNLLQKDFQAPFLF